MLNPLFTRRDALVFLTGATSVAAGALVGCKNESAPVGSDVEVSTEAPEQSTEEALGQSAEEALDELAWWKKSIAYELYPKSFLDTEGGGTGTLAGVTQKLDYLASLGVGIIWLTPVYASPQKDNGYDVSDYYAIDPSFGTMEDMETLIAEAANRGIRIVMDLVMNHTSDECSWFQESRSSRDNPKADWYIWRDRDDDGTEPTNWRGIFGGSCWTWDETREQFYMHTFADFQPDLNWECEEVRAELIRMARFWLEKGVGGFRIDAIPYIKKPEFVDAEVDAEDGLSSVHEATANTEGILEFLREFKREVMEGTDAFTVAEANGVMPEDLPEWVGDNGVFDMVFEFNHLGVVGSGQGKLEAQTEWKLTDLKKTFAASEEVTAHNGWYPVFFENHDKPRSTDMFTPHAKDKDAAAKMLGCVLLTMRGTPFVYQAEELGFTNVAWPSIDDYDDVSTTDLYESALRAGQTEEEALAYAQAYARENARTPMQWDTTENAGFTTGTPWLPVHDDYETQNVAVEEEDPDSVMSNYRELAALRDAYPVLIVGDWTQLMADSEEVFAYERAYGQDRAVVLANFTEDAVDYDASLVEGLDVAYSTHETSQAGTLQPLEAVVYAGKA